MSEEQTVDEAAAAQQPAPQAVNRSIPVGLNEAALDSPTFRATAAHFAEQTDAVEKWLNGYMTSTTKLTHDILALEETINSYLSKTIPSAADGVIDNDYTFLALKRVGDGSREYWMQMLSSMKKMDNLVIEPIRTFLGIDMRNFKEVRRNLEQSQRAYDTMLARYVAQSKTKEPSALREDAFSVYETRKAYIQASMDYCQLAPQLRFTMDKLLVKVCTEIWKEMKRSRDATANATRWGQEMERVRGWAKEMELSEGVFKRELQSARRDLSAATFEEFRPSREIEDYSASTVAFLRSRGPVNMRHTTDETAVISEKQGWLFLRTVAGKPVRHTWMRRWYYCRDGVFGWLIPGPQGVLQGDEIGVLLCNAKPAAGEDRRFCFEVKTKSQNMLLQAETQKELTEWLEVFEVIKKKVFESSVGRDSQALIGGGPDPAFSISPPAIPEFSAKTLDAHLGQVEEQGPPQERSATLGVPAQELSPNSRQSFDPNGSISRRSITALGRDLARDQGESGRDHAVRLMQKLDLHRKVAFGAGGEAALAGPGGTAGGIASLISASHNLLPNNANPLLSGKHNTQMLPSVDSHPGTLAPLTLAKPPATTHLSRIAVIAAAERSSVNDSNKLPTSVVANYWGSNVWAAINVASQPMLPRLDEDDPIGVVVSESAQTPLSMTAREQQASDSFMLNYPPELKAQYAQFRLLFPSVPLDEKLVLVFRAAWTSSREKDSNNQPLLGDGRIYVSPENMYFYGQHLGLVTAYSISLDFITEVSAAAGRDCDFIFLQLGQDTNDTGYTRISIKVFLGDLHLLQTRLNLLIDNLQAEEPMNTDDIISTLIKIEQDGFERPSPIAENMDDARAGLPDNNGLVPSGSTSRQYYSNAGPAGSSSRSPRMQPSKLHLPSHPVVYEPADMELATERTFEISAKACFHVLFGDKSFVFPKLYFERRAQEIAQGPWVLIDQGKMRREFRFQVDYVDMLGRSKTATVNDHQTIDVFNEHVTYVVTHTKTAWHLPHSQLFKVINKTVITHVAKSKCKLAIYLKVAWSKSPALSKNLVEKQALRDAESDADEQAELATDQVRKLGARSRTNRAIQVYGHVGQQTQVVVFSPASNEPTKKQAIKPRTLTAMMLETARSFGESAVSSVIMWAFAGLRKLFKVITAQKLLLFILGLSALANLYLSSNEMSTWWKERKAASFMQTIGIGPNTMMSKAIYMADLDEASGAAGRDMAFPQNSTCFATFREILDATDMDAPWEEAGAAFSAPTTRSTAQRLRRTRQRLGSYRHDLLVAMRVVNSVEREMLQSEWENWLINETSLCDELDEVIRADGEGSQSEGDADGGDGAQKVMRSLSPEHKKTLKEWRKKHCWSCKADYMAVMVERKLGASLGSRKMEYTFTGPE